MNASGKGSVLVLDDEKNIVTVISAILEKQGFSVDGFTNGHKAMEALAENDFDVAITDLYMPDMDGMCFLEQVNQKWPVLPVIMITAFGTVDSAVDAIKKGAFDYVTKPFEQSEILFAVEKAVHTKRLSQFEVISGGQTYAQAEAELSPLLLGVGKEMQQIQDLIFKVAASPSSVLIAGESGTGKEVLVEDLHKFSDRKEKSLIKVNCAAVPVGLLDAEIFGGHKMGRLEMAHNGTLFIDEVSEMNVECQMKLLQFLEEGHFENVENQKYENINVRVIASTNKDLKEEVEEGRFREDLYYKLNVVPVYLPALRERKEDLRELVEHFITKLNVKLNKKVTGMTESCLELFRSFPWPGNFRQLENVLERMMLLSESVLLRETDLPEELQVELKQTKVSSQANLRDRVRQETQRLEKDLIVQALEENSGNVTKTAQRLGISRKGLQLKIKDLGIK